MRATRAEDARGGGRIGATPTGCEGSMPEQTDDTPRTSGRIVGQPSAARASARPMVDAAWHPRSVAERNSLNRMAPRGA
mgnify:CR=1 FL=1